MLKYVMIFMLLCSSCFAEPVKFYFAVDQTADKQKILTWFQKYHVDYHIINRRGGYIFANALIPNLEDIPNIQKIFEIKGFIVLAAFKLNGVQVGRRRILKELQEYLYSGSATHVFNKTAFLALMKDIKTYDANGVELTSTRPIVERESHNYLGWGTAVFPKDEL